MVTKLHSSRNGLEGPCYIRLSKKSSSYTFAMKCLVLFCAFLATVSKAAAKDVCACSPSTYQFTFNFDLKCPPPGGSYGPGIAEVTCFITSYSADVLDLKPVAVQSISIIESDVDRVPIAQSAIEGNFENGDNFTYSSVSALSGNASRIPQSIQLTISATNAVNSSLVQVWAIKYTNDCGVYPVLEKGQSFGWTVFTDLGSPRHEICPAAPPSPTTFAPTAPGNSEILEGGPSAEPSSRPIATPSPKGKKSPAPTTVVVEPPNLSPTKAPKKGKKQNESSSSPPTALPTIAPATKVPVEPPNMPSTSPTIANTIEATPAPEMSFSYEFTMGEDFDITMEWGRGKKKKKIPKDGSRRSLGPRVRVGQRNRFKR